MGQRVVVSSTLLSGLVCRLTIRFTIGKCSRTSPMRLQAIDLPLLPRPSCRSPRSHPSVRVPLRALPRHSTSNLTWTICMDALPTIPSRTSSINSNTYYTGRQTGAGISAARLLPSKTREDAAFSRDGLPVGGERGLVIGPSRSSSLRHTNSLADLDHEFASALSRGSRAASHGQPVAETPLPASPPTPTQSRPSTSGYETAMSPVSSRISAAEWVMATPPMTFFSGPAHPFDDSAFIRLVYDSDGS